MRLMFLYNSTNSCTIQKILVQFKKSSTIQQILVQFVNCQLSKQLKKIILQLKV